jgi:RNA polymerase sigma factor (sigma-70 family)
MSAALQLPVVWAAESIFLSWRRDPTELNVQASSTDTELTVCDEAVPEIGLAFYRSHTEKMLKRYFYASMLVGRSPSILGEPIARGWVSCRRIRTFEDAVIFVIDIERCLKRLGAFDRAVLSRIALQEYTHRETAALLGISPRTVYRRYRIALDRLTELLLSSGLLILPPS